jgi:hypothetical protein
MHGAAHERLLTERVLPSTGIENTETGEWDPVHLPVEYYNFMYRVSTRGIMGSRGLFRGNGGGRGRFVGRGCGLYRACI